jgi:hypothetical protein
MRSTPEHLLAALILLPPMACGAVASPKSIQDYERQGIDKIARFSEREHSTILFSLADELIGYAKDGRVGWISSGHADQNTNCGHAHPALSHDALRVAFVSDGDTSKHCSIVIYDIPTGTRRNLAQITPNAGEMSWSWDDTEIASFDVGISLISVSSISVKDGREKVLPVPTHSIAPGSINGGGAYVSGMRGEWLHNGKSFIVDLSVEVPTKRPAEYKPEWKLITVSEGGVRALDNGYSSAVSPTSNRIAFYSSKGIALINADGTEKTLLSKSPQGLLSIFFDFPNRGIDRTLSQPETSRPFRFHSPTNHKTGFSHLATSAFCPIHPSGS